MRSKVHTRLNELVGPLSLLGFGALGKFLFIHRLKQSSRLFTVLVSAATLAGCGAGGRGLLNSEVRKLDPSLLAPFPFTFSLDRLGSFFLILICSVSLPVVLFSVSYVRRHYSRRAPEMALGASVPFRCLHGRGGGRLFRIRIPGRLGDHDARLGGTDPDRGKFGRTPAQPFHLSADDARRHRRCDCSLSCFPAPLAQPGFRRHPRRGSSATPGGTDCSFSPGLCGIRDEGWNHSSSPLVAEGSPDCAQPGFCLDVRGDVEDSRLRICALCF